ncbi:MAG: hypothetical protein ACOYL5_06980 [Phototrophicaceae bacterium]|jgi:hypothetical protein
MGRYLERGTDIYKDKPERVYATKIERKNYARRVRFGLLTALAGGGVWLMLSLQRVRDGIPPTFGWLGVALGVGQLVAALVLAVGLIRWVANVVYWFRRRDETLLFYDQGFVWNKGKNEAKYSWNALKSVRVRVDNRQLFGRTWFQSGAVTFTMRDGSVFRFTPIHGNVEEFLVKVEPHIAAVQGTRYGQLLRDGKGFQVHPNIAVTPEGIVLDKKTRLGWKTLQVSREPERITFAQLDAEKRPRIVSHYPIHEIDNVGGFMELVETTTENYQRPNPYR